MINIVAYTEPENNDFTRAQKIAIKIKTEKIERVDIMGKNSELYLYGGFPSGVGDCRPCS